MRSTTCSRGWQRRRQGEGGREGGSRVALHRMLLGVQQESHKNPSGLVFSNLARSAGAGAQPHSGQPACCIGVELRPPPHV
jgi:hypothetical protein